MTVWFNKLGLGAFFALLFVISHIDPALAQTNTVNDVVDNMATSTERLPGLVAAIAYLLGLLIGVTGVLKLKDHVENPTQTPLRISIVRFIAGGALFALPIIYEVVFTTISGGASNLSFSNNAIANDISGFIGAIGGLGGFAPNINGILENIKNSVDEIPGFIAAVAYLLGLVIGVQAILKAKDHVENPDQNPLKESVIRFLVAGALFAIPTIYNAMFDVVGGNGLGIIGNIQSLFGGAGFFLSSYAQNACNPIGGGFAQALGTSSLGQSLCTVILHTGAFPAFLTACAYVIGLVFGIWGIFKIRDHVLNPQQTSVWEGVSRLIAGGAFFALPVVVEVARATLTPATLTASGLAPVTAYNNGTGFLQNLINSILGGGACNVGGGPLGLDGILVCFMGDIMAPLHVVLNFFAFCAGMIFLMIGVSRLIKSAQDGARGPGGIGTIMTFVTGAALISYNEMIRAFSTSSGMSNALGQTRTFATLQYTQGMQQAEIGHAHAVITSIIQFVIVVGLISFVRGIFIIRSVAEGNQQASVMAGVTHLVGGALAVNLGPLINAVQTTLGLTGYGIAFS